VITRVGHDQIAPSKIIAQGTDWRFFEDLIKRGCLLHLLTTGIGTGPLCPHVRDDGECWRVSGPTTDRATIRSVRWSFSTETMGPSSANSFAQTDCVAGVVRLELGNAASGLCWRTLTQPCAFCRDISST
jgi:hypothetical protein